MSELEIFQSNISNKTEAHISSMIDWWLGYEYPENGEGKKEWQIRRDIFLPLLLNRKLSLIEETYEEEFSAN